MAAGGGEIAGVGEETVGGAAAVNAHNVVEEGVLPVFTLQ
jgi:hypothetical protein